jgi:outer membrane protein OmpA-like peptidoglycan-associated protein
MDVRLTDRLTFNLEGNTNMLPDHFNSKKGRNDNKDWVTNVLLGLKIALGPTTNKPAPVSAPVVQEVVEQPAAQVAPARVVEPAPVVQPAPVVEKREPMRIEVFFDINKTVIKDSETGKLQELVAFLKKYPTDLVSLTGYADRDTGTSAINRRLSIGRAAAVKKYLQDAGISANRIITDAKGDTVQPNNTPASNRVVICITETK